MTIHLPDWAPDEAAMVLPLRQLAERLGVTAL
jgi:hypothetical protein